MINYKFGSFQLSELQYHVAGDIRVWGYVKICWQLSCEFRKKVCQNEGKRERERESSSLFIRCAEMNRMPEQRALKLMKRIERVF